MSTIMQRFFFVVLFVTYSVWQAVASSVRISRCEICDDDIPGQECSGQQSNEGDNCYGTEPYCSTRISGTGTRTKVWKGCATEQTCINDWWLATSNNPACSQSAVTSGHVASGVTCLFCCHEETPGGVYCNSDLYPQYLSQFPGIDNTVTTTTTTTTTETPQDSRTTCPVCVSDTTTGQTCDEANDLDLCGDSTPYCMTSFYREPDGYRLEKRCASHNECVQLWLTGTLTNSACVTHGLLAGNGSDLECHYCCHNTLAGNVCNLDPQQVIPDHLMGAHHGIITAPPVTTASTPTYHGGHGHNQQTGTPDNGKHAMPCISCTTNSTTGQSCDESNDIDICHEPNHYCMTSLYRTPHSYAVVKSCATPQACERLWWDSTFTNNNKTCLDLDLSPGTGSDLECHYCCFYPDSDRTFCNDDHSKVVPKYLIVMGQGTHTYPTTSSPKPTTAGTTTHTPATTAATTTTPTPPAGTTCQVCLQDPSSQQYCMDTDVQTCSGHDELFCLNTVTFSGAGVGQISVSKTCATQSVCESEWYNKTRHVPVCLQHQPSPAAGHSQLVCSYCCNSSDITGSPCNVFDKPTNLVDFHIPTPSPQPTTTATTPKQPTTGVPPSCAVCDDMCIFFQQEQPCPSGFCMTSITDDDFYSRVVTKSCVTEDECYKRWWQETSDQPLCLDIMSESSGPTGVATSCNYCCHGDKCNSPDFPSQDTLYDGNNRGHYPIG